MVGLRHFVAVVITVGAFVLAPPSDVAAQSPGPDDIVLWTAAASPSDVLGDWVRETDSTAAAGVVLRNRDRGRRRPTTALASPADYFEMRFTATASTAYHLWIRMRPGDSNRNDSVHVQFSDSVNAIGQAAFRIGSTESAEVVLRDGPTGATPQGWGWADNGWGSLGAPIYFAADGAHVLRIQRREGGAVIDQIVLSPVVFSSTAPGPRTSDTRVLPAANGLGPNVSAGTSVIRVASAAAGRMFGTWQTISDASAAGSQALRNPDAGAASITPALSNPASYFEATFNADAGKAYHVWVRIRADGDSMSNDSVHVQFNDSVTSSSAATARIGTTRSMEVVLQNGSNGPAPHAWGWTDNGWGSLGAHVYFASSGTHTIRVQQREDGPRIDQIVISPDGFLTSPPGWRRDDITILQASAAPSPPPSPANAPPTVSLTSPIAGATFTAPATIALAATASDPENRLAKVDFYSGASWLASDTSAPFSFSWGSVAAGSYQLKAVATDAEGASTSSAIVTVTVAAPPTTTTTKRVAFTASVDHAIVTRYLLEVFPPTANPATATAIASSDLGKPTPGAGNEIIVDRTTFLNGLAPGNYLITVASVGAGGSSRSAAIAFTR
jgi:hypothetical protein